MRSSVNHVLGANFENLTLTGSFGVNGTGNELNNVLTGNSGKNVLNGMAGDDTLVGGGGADVLIGGDGADHFVFSAASSTQATISDFNAVDGGLAEGDLLEFVGLLTGTFAYVGGSAFSGGDDNTEARFINGALQLDFDGNGATDLTIRITGSDCRDPDFGRRLPVHLIGNINSKPWGWSMYRLALWAFLIWFLDQTPVKQNKTPQSPRLAALCFAMGLLIWFRPPATPWPQRISASAAPPQTARVDPPSASSGNIL